MNTKPVPVIITLSAALLSCVVSIIQRVEFSVFVSRLLVVVLIFLVMGTIIKMILDYSFKTLEPAVPLDEEMDSVVPEGQGLEESQENVTTDDEYSEESEEG